MNRIRKFAGAEWDRTEVEFTMSAEMAENVLKRPGRYSKVMIEAAKQFVARKSTEDFHA